MNQAKNQLIQDKLPIEKEIFDEPALKKEKIPDNLPEPRSNGSIQIKFTPRVFPTPSRESQDQLEREVKKNRHLANLKKKNLSGWKNKRKPESWLNYLMI